MSDGQVGGMLELLMEEKELFLKLTWRNWTVKQL